MNEVQPPQEPEEVWTPPDAEDGDPVGDLVPALEALLFVADEPLSLDELQEVLPQKERGLAEEAMRRLMARYDDEERGLQILRVAGGYRMTTRGRYERYLRALHRQRNRVRLGRASLETLAIIAYQQPITAPEISEIRGVDSTGVVRTLLEHGLIRTRGRKAVVGKPILYGTTREFLVHFGLDTLEDLPSLEEFNAMISEAELDLPAAEETVAPEEE